MKLRFLLILPWVLALLLSCRVALADDSFPMSAADYFDTDEVTDAIPQEGQEVLDDLGISGWSEESLLSLTPEQFLHTAWEAFAQAFRQPAWMLAVLVGAALLTMLLEGTQDTLIMIGVSTVFAYLIGLPLGVLLSISQPHGIWPHKWFNRILGWIINVGRSLPFIILMIAIMDFTKLIVGTKLGVPGAIVPLVVSAAPFIARMVETSLAEVDAGVVEAAQSMGASRLQIVWKVYLPEAVPSLILGASISIITLLGYTAIAGAVGAGGLGDLAIRYGYQRNVPSMMLATVVLIIVLVQIIQSLFSWLSTKMDKRLR